MLTDVEIAQNATLEPIATIAESLGLSPADYRPIGWHMAKIEPRVRERLADRRDGKLVLLTATSPTPAGEGKTTVNVGLSMALNRLGHRAISALREPSLGPVFGRKGGAAGGGYAQLVPMEEINLHFTGDFHAITSAHNLLSAMIDNHLHFGNALDIDPESISWPRVLDMNDRALRRFEVTFGPAAAAQTRATGFEITAASEIMAIFCLAEDLADLKERLGRIIIGRTRSGEAVRAAELDATGAMALLLRDAMAPNLVQTLENTPAIVHGGPFANIAHGTNSLIATRLALKLADYVITEAGFGADLGAEKYLDIVCPAAGFTPDATVLVTTLRSLRFNGGAPVGRVGEPDAAAVERGLVNLERHLENLAKFGTRAVVALNSFPADAPDEVELVRDCAGRFGVRFAEADVFSRGGPGGEDLARAVVEACGEDSCPTPLYERADPLREKIETVAREVYRASGVDLSDAAAGALDRLTADGFGNLPICIAKTQYSFSADPERLGAPSGFRLPVRDVVLNAGAGFVVVIVGATLRMPGLPRRPAAADMNVLENGTIVGLS